MTVEEYAKTHGRLHPEIVEFLTGYFVFGPPSSLLFDLRRVKVSVQFGSSSISGSGIWALASTVVVQKGKFNAEFKQWNVEKGDGKLWWQNNRAIDLETPAGMRVLAHECFHVMKWQTRRWWSFWAVGRAMLGKITGRPWHSSEWERQAIDFEKGIANSIVRRTEELKVFEGLR